VPLLSGFKTRSIITHFSFIHRLQVIQLFPTKGDDESLSNGCRTEMIAQEGACYTYRRKFWGYILIKRRCITFAWGQPQLDTNCRNKRRGTSFIKTTIYTTVELSGTLASYLLSITTVCDSAFGTVGNSPQFAELRFTPSPGGKLHYLFAQYERG
jgi:hypothetical protein